ncbi:uncharacterized protein LOC134814916 [Bolinopsis microptera]|uniref:uncharacterized protein LOC134814916 n=1 Tax=Bolinopsis microptera TaxID=2820187 RepID=UPI00307AA23B
MSEPTTYAAVTHGALTHGSTTYYALNSTGGTVATVEKEAVETHDNIWSARELNILGGFLWLAVIITLVGNLSCFYAVWKNLKKILEHPFFQSNVFCVLLSVVDVLLVLLVGIPAAVFFTAESEWLGNSFYNLAMVEAILDYLVWLQLLLVVAICLDRAGHICRPLTYTFSIKARKTTAACLFCVIIPFLLLTVPYIIVLNKSMAIAAETVSSLDDREIARSFIERSTFKCKSYAYNNGTDADINIFMSCTVMTPPKDKWEGGKHFLKWENVAHPMVLLAAILSLLVSNGLIIRKLVESAAFQKDNAKRQEEVAKSIRMSSIVSTLQAVTLLVCTLPMRVAQMEKRFEIWERV